MAGAPPTHQSTIDPCYTVTPHKSHILEHAHIPMTDWPLPIHHRSMLYHYTSPANWPYIPDTPLHLSWQLTIDPCYTVTPHKSAQGICALCSMWNWWGCSGVPCIYCWLQEGWGQSVIKLIQCNGLPEIHAQLTRGYILSEGTPHLKIWPNSAWDRSSENWGVHLVWGYTSSENNSLAVLCFASQKVFSSYIRKT